MGFYEVFLIGVGLSMDAFAASICKGLNMKIMKKTQVFIISLFFGGFQALMPFVGWIFGKQFESYITRFDHWVAFFSFETTLMWAFILGMSNSFNPFWIASSTVEPVNNTITRFLLIFSFSVLFSKLFSSCLLNLFLLAPPLLFQQ